ncbi:MAG TPA: hypothetical protein PLJ35_12125 [Anaerolineae bacterium]|nr:hypothetical protein [Anaerolineae bacterium]HOQ99559.1 hypothetical protein [Anaerolineae bacterium]HPL27932.1 hypothetical protein [Anaerolineae bacterium]
MTAKGRFGLSLAAVAVIGFGFGMLRQPLAVLLVCGFALLAEKEEWLNRQAMQALLLTIAYHLIVLVTGWAFGALAWLVGLVKLYSVSNVVHGIHGFVDGVVYLALVALSLLAILRVLRGQEANLPLLAKLAQGDLAAPPEKAPPVPYTPSQPAAPAPAAPVPPAPQPAPAAPVPPAPEPVPAAPVPPEPGVPAVKKCPSCLAPLKEGTTFCTECGARIA